VRARHPIDAELSSVPEEIGVPTAEQMIKRLVEAHEQTAKTA